MPAARYRLAASGLLAALMGLLAQLSFRVGPVPYTMQNAGFVLAGLLLPPRFALLSQLIYLAMVAAGAPLAAGLRGGVGVLLGPTGGYLAAFPLSAALVSVARERYMRGRCLSGAGRGDLAALWALSCAAALPVYLLGYAVFRYWASIDRGLAAWACRVSGALGLPCGEHAILVASVLIFLPQDFLMDHVLALLVAWRVARALPQVCALLSGCRGGAA